MSKILFSNMILSKIFVKNKINRFVKINSLIIINILIFSGTNLLFGQKITYPKHQIGLSYSSFSGAGINYQFEPDKYQAIQFSVLPYYYSKENNDLQIIGLVGIEYQLNILKNNKSRYYVFVGSSMNHLEDRLTTKKVINDVEYIEKNITTNRIYNFGFGAGIEYKPLPVFSISPSIGILYQISEKSSYSEFWDRNPGGETFLGIGCGISIRYVF